MFIPDMSIGIIGYGSFGAFVHELYSRFGQSMTVKVSSGRFEPDGVTFFPYEEVCVPVMW